MEDFGKSTIDRVVDSVKLAKKRGLDGDFEAMKQNLDKAKYLIDRILEDIPKRD